MTAVVHAPVDLTVVAAAQVRSDVLEALSGTEAVELDLSGVEDLDTAGLQLLLLASREARIKGIDLTFGSPSLVVLETLDLVGLSTALGRDGR